MQEGCKKFPQEPKMSLVGNSPDAIIRDTPGTTTFVSEDPALLVHDFARLHKSGDLYVFVPVCDNKLSQFLKVAVNGMTVCKVYI